jgi:hypothetical protein
MTSEGKKPRGTGWFDRMFQGIENRWLRGAAEVLVVLMIALVVGYIGSQLINGLLSFS